jgi:hypothetical protein
MQQCPGRTGLYAVIIGVFKELVMLLSVFRESLKTSVFRDFLDYTA